MQIGGWRTRAVFDRYNIRASRDAVRAGERLAEYYEKFGHNSGTICTETVQSEKAQKPVVN